MRTHLRGKRLLAFLCTIAAALHFSTAPVYAFSENEIRTTLHSDEIQHIISQAMEGDKAPGASITVTNGTEILYEQYGFSNIRAKTPVTEDTLFELGSTTKAFTALAMLVLEDEGVLSLEDNVSKYVPWFNVNYNGKNVEITIEQLIHHSSGLPEKTINRFPEGTSDDLLEKTARLAEGMTLDFYPGADFEYANIGYDLLAYILETVTGKKYEDVVQEKILRPLGMNNSYFNLDQAKQTGHMAQGYLPFFMRAAEYDAPRYQGSLADGYLITCAKDMGRWLNAQLGRGDVPEQLARLIAKSHMINNEIVAGTFEGKPLYYAYGWIVSKDGTYITHSGANPSFTSNIIILPKTKLAISVQSNSPGSQTVSISQAILKSLHHEPLPELSFSHGAIDKISSISMIIVTVLIIAAAVLLLTMKKRICAKKRIHFKKERLLFFAKLILGISSALLLAIWPYLINYSIYMIRVWMPSTLLMANVLCFILSILLLVSSIIRFKLVTRIDAARDTAL
ncbi:beta-lactamase family protein [Paenibacillus dendritiformis]|uniref:serine hydrolase domain-containing protein n=1 Tax=Paenibacillus dendritiformis TaxID=130049 RepID=UPI00143DD392|nr:serine hydrolase domain-containing protein [Paenibacillus dendritiformis]NKI22314.1 beta-lactamase family protein [Paenibacillus dendritiformis]NRF99520.1 serine hydrolase [Paenibacillus dendritiformis]